MTGIKLGDGGLGCWQSGVGSTQADRGRRELKVCMGPKSIRNSEALWICKWKKGIQRSALPMEGAFIPGL